MAMTDDNNFPRLTPPDDRFTALDGLLRKTEELTDDQFDLLAAAWAEESLEGDSLAEFNSVIAAIPSRRARAESFREVRLTPYNDRWIFRKSLRKQSPETKAIRRTLVITLLSVAAVIAIIITLPAIRNRTTDILPGVLPDGAVMSEALIPEASPVIIPERVNMEPAAVSKATKTNRQAVQTPRALPIALANYAVNPALTAAVKSTDLQAMNREAIKPVPAEEKADNWIVRGISLIAKAVTKEDKNIDGYVIASACVNGINNVLGWEMQLEQANNKAGETVAVNFSSSLLSFTTPVNKNSR